MTNQLSKIYWLWIPLVAIIVQAILEITVPRDILSIMHSENGPHETLQFLVMVSCFFVALKAMVSTHTKDIMLRAWFGLALLGSLYVAGEEVSWGQHFWDWATPDFWSEVNDQQETNLHNTSSWLDQKPRLILEIGIIFGGLVYPLLKNRKIFTLPAKLDFLMPAKQLGFIALLVIVPKILEKAFEAVDISIFARFSEVQELYMFYFVLLYLIMLSRKVKNSENT